MEKPHLIILSDEVEPALKWEQKKPPSGAIPKGGFRLWRLFLSPKQRRPYTEEKLRSSIEGAQILRFKTSFAQGMPPEPRLDSLLSGCYEHVEDVLVEHLGEFLGRLDPRSSEQVKSKRCSL